MGRRKIDIEEEEDLAECIRQFKCLYDKTLEEYKNKRAKANAWPNSTLFLLLLLFDEAILLVSSLLLLSLCMVNIERIFFSCFAVFIHMLVIHEVILSQLYYSAVSVDTQK